MMASLLDKIRMNRNEMKADHEKLMAKMIARQEKIKVIMEASLEMTEATDLEAHPEEIVSDPEHQEVPKEEGAVKTSLTLKKWDRDGHLGTGHRGKPKERNQARTGRGGYWPPPAEGPPAVQKWHGGKGHVVRKNQTRDKVVPGIPKGRTLREVATDAPRKQHWIKNRDFKEKLPLGSERISNGIYRKTLAWRTRRK
jgi:hypothetical protein